MRSAILFLLAPISVLAETRTLTLKDAVDLAMKQSPEVVLARIDEQKAAQAVRIAQDPFVPKVFAGSGLAYSSGFPMSIGGSSPSIVEARAVQSVFNRPQKYQVAKVREDARTAALDSTAKRDQVALQTATLYLDAERSARMAQAAREQTAALEKVAQSVQSRVAEGRELEIENKRAALNLARARVRVGQLDSDRTYAEESLAAVLGLPPEDQVRIALEDSRPTPGLPESEEAAAAAALAQSKDLRRLESALLAKGYEVRSYKAARLPTVDLVAQYGLFAKFNNYEDFFQRFQRHNGQLGISFQIPLLVGSAASGQAVQAELDTVRLRAEVNQTRGRVAAQARRAYQQSQNAQAGAEVARLDLEMARDQLSILLALLSEGRATLRQVEEARFAEQEKWLSLYDARYAAEKARYELLRHTGDIVAALRQ
jgi:outer membrane protein TolC